MKSFILAHRTKPVADVALLLTKHPEWDARFVLQQIEGWQRMRTKVPSWTDCEDLIYPPRLALEQCSGEAAAAYKGEIISRLFGKSGGEAMADLTGGMGIDFSHTARHFGHATYVEQRPELVALARHNMPILGLKNCDFIEENAIEWLSRQDKVFDLLFLDPARRDTAGRKTVGIADCEPDVLMHKALLYRHSRILMLKLSPMLDLTAALRALPETSEAHVFAEHGECKDLLLVIDRRTPRPADAVPTIYIRDGVHALHFTQAEEHAAEVRYTDAVGKYLYEPSAAVLKAGAYRTIAARYELSKLHRDAHLYTSDVLCEDFPGRRFEVVQVVGFGKRELRSLDLPDRRANLTVRGFPATVADLRRRLRLADGGDAYVFATTLADNRHVLVHCRKCAGA